MKAIIKEVKWLKEFESKFGMLQSFKVSYDDKTAFYNSKKKDQTNFVKGQEAEFTEEERTGNNNSKYLIIKPLRKDFKQSNYGRALVKEQSRYTTMGASYVKDMIIAGNLDIKQWHSATEKLVRFMHNLDEEINK